MRPARMLRRVVLPLPLAPTRTMNSFSKISSETSSSAFTTDLGDLNVLEMPFEPGNQRGRRSSGFDWCVPNEVGLKRPFLS